jgi:hypothetical protein
VRLLFGGTTGELDLLGSRAELVALGRQVRRAEGKVRLTVMRDPAPFDSSLRWVMFGRIRAGRVSLRVEGDRLHVEGAGEYLALLADDLEAFAAGGDGSGPLHVDHVPDHPYLAAGSASLVVELDEGARFLRDDGWQKVWLVDRHRVAIRHGQGPEEAFDNVDVGIESYGGRRWTATVLTPGAITECLRRHQATGESGGGAYLRIPDMLVVPCPGVEAILDAVRALLREDGLGGLPELEPDDTDEPDEPADPDGLT